MIYRLLQKAKLVCESRVRESNLCSNNSAEVRGKNMDPFFTIAVIVLILIAYAGVAANLHYLFEVSPLLL